ncbi:MAG: DUF563 domain-containing protein [Chthoniobacterales bacterium]|nr:DUF563 domain-containing protein [Chthoniobacterales bacterium]
MVDKAVGYYLSDNKNGDPHVINLMLASASESGQELAGLYNDDSSADTSLNRRGLVDAMTRLSVLGANRLLIHHLSDVFSNRTDADFLIGNALVADRIVIQAVDEALASDTEDGRKRLAEYARTLTDAHVPLSIQASKAIGEVSYLTLLKSCHEILRPDLYVEIGVKYGKSMLLASCRAVGIDPVPRKKGPLPNLKAEIHTATSDAFFANPRLHKVIPPGTIDLAFIDGMHLFEFALRDFINIEKNSHSRTVVVIDDVCPRNALEAMPDWLVQSWAGDIWKLIVCLRRFRPELEVVVTDAHPTGIALVAGLNATNTVLVNQYSEIIEHFSEVDYCTVGDYRDYVLSKFPSNSPYIAEFLKKKRRAIPLDLTSDQGLCERVEIDVGGDPRYQNPTFEVLFDGSSLNGPAAPRFFRRWRDVTMCSPAVGISLFKDVSFVRATEVNRACFFDENGGLLSASLVPRYGYGSNGAGSRLKRLGGRVLLHQTGNYDRDDVVDLMETIDEVVDEPTFLLGFLDKQFGHFLTESLSRTWALDHPLARDCKFLVWADNDILPFHREALNLLGISENSLIYGNRALKFRRLLIPDRGYRLFGAASPVMTRSWDRIRSAGCAKTSTRTEGRLYLSRRGNPKRRLLKEKEVEALFERLDFNIVQPETLSFTQQVALVGSCNRLAGSFGSQMHLSMFMPSEAKKLILAPSNFVFPDEAIISSVKSVATAFFIAPSNDTALADSISSDWDIDLEVLENCVEAWMTA